MVSERGQTRQTREREKQRERQIGQGMRERDRQKETELGHRKHIGYGTAILKMY